MKVEDFVHVLDSEFYTGVPDSQLKALCNYLINNYGIDEKHHLIAANEGNSTALAAGYHLATGKIPVVYMQNSGEGNIINPVASLLNDQVYAIPAIFVIGWRGQPGIHDEPQHIYQGKITCELLDLMDIENFVVSEDTTIDELYEVMVKFNESLKAGKSVAFVIRKNALTYDEKVVYENDNEIFREEIIEHIVNVSGEDPIISTTGKASRELFEIRESKNQSHKYDFLTVGSMGHSSSIALGVAINKPEKRVWCVDGDGALLMHMGSMPVIGNVHPDNLVHILINNGAHETVGGMPTVASNMDFIAIAKACGYDYAVSVDNLKDLDEELIKIKNMGKLCFIEVLSAIGARNDLGRPTTTTLENKENFMKFLD
ncbi:MAG: phosphonopyruvate decarboxylase [Methanobrevibacter sp.]|uniref:phosphonopyruvate decarboxylase n=1 Tax=Methanobrevibacter sp. TaxID=66852 RepID=UPI003F0383AA